MLLFHAGCYFQLTNHYVHPKISKKISCTKPFWTLKISQIFRFVKWNKKVFINFPCFSFIVFIQFYFEKQYSVLKIETKIVSLRLQTGNCCRFLQNFTRKNYRQLHMPLAHAQYDSRWRPLQSPVFHPRIRARSRGFSFEVSF